MSNPTEDEIVEALLAMPLDQRRRVITRALTEPKGKRLLIRQVGRSREESHPVTDFALAA